MVLIALTLGSFSAHLIPNFNYERYDINNRFNPDARRKSS